LVAAIAMKNLKTLKREIPVMAGCLTRKYPADEGYKQAELPP